MPPKSTRDSPSLVYILKKPRILRRRRRQKHWHAPFSFSSWPFIDLVFSSLSSILRTVRRTLPKAPYFIRARKIFTWDIWVFSRIIFLAFIIPAPPLLPFPGTFTAGSSLPSPGSRWLPPTSATAAGWRYRRLRCRRLRCRQVPSCRGRRRRTTCRGRRNSTRWAEEGAWNLAGGSPVATTTKSRENSSWEDSGLENWICSEVAIVKKHLFHLLNCILT